MKKKSLFNYDYGTMGWVDNPESHISFPPKQTNIRPKTLLLSADLQFAASTKSPK